MKKLALLGVIVLAIFLVQGCSKEDDIVVIASPTGLTIVVAGADSLSIHLDWTASTTADIDGYVIYFNGTVEDTTTNTSITMIPNELGEYYIRAYKDSDYSDPSNTVTTELVESSNQGPLYDFDAPSAVGPSGYGWLADGSGSEYSMITANQESVDVYVDSDFDLASPSREGSGWKVTPIAFDIGWDYDNLDVAPITGYVDWEDIVDGGTYVLYVNDTYYVKIEITEVGTSQGFDYIRFRYGFQSVAGFRRMG
jgi:hypothetical protein